MEHIKDIITEDTGGGCIVDYIMLKSGKVIGIGIDESIGLYDEDLEFIKNL